MKHGDEAYRIFRELLRQKRVNFWLRVENELRNKPKQTTKPAYCGSAPMDNSGKSFKTHYEEEEWTDGKMRMDWWSFKGSDGRTMVEALELLTRKLIIMVGIYGKPEKIEWIIKVPGDILNPLYQRVKEKYCPDHDSTIGWKAFYKRN